MNKKAILIVILIVLLMICSFVLLFVNKSETGTVAIVYVNNEVYTTIDLTQKKYREYAIKTEMGYNLVIVENGKICVTDSDCPDKICVKTGFIDGGVPIICMPHKLEIVVLNNEVDGFAA